MWLVAALDAIAGVEARIGRREKMLSWTKTSDVTCYAGRKKRSAVSAGPTDGTHVIDPVSRTEAVRRGAGWL
jgi:hypothetical protein